MEKLMLVHVVLKTYTLHSSVSFDFSILNKATGVEDVLLTENRRYCSYLCLAQLVSREVVKASIIETLKAETGIDFEFTDENTK